MRPLLKIIALFVFALSFTACQNSKSLQKYIVEKSENPDFITMNISPKDFLKKSIVLEENPLESIKNINVLLFNKDDKQQLNKEYEEIKNLLKNEKYQELVRTTSKGVKFQIDYVGTDENIEEVIVLVNQNQEKLALLRILSNGLTINDLSKIPTALDGNSIDKEGVKKTLEKLTETLKK